VESAGVSRNAGFTAGTVAPELAVVLSPLVVVSGAGWLSGGGTFTLGRSIGLGSQ
jgi:hypothetical protein